ASCPRANASAPPVRTAPSQRRDSDAPGQDAPAPVSAPSGAGASCPRPNASAPPVDAASGRTYVVGTLPDRLMPLLEPYFLQPEKA
ncbi:MAG: hypothetical protein ACOCVJ_03010, partial [Verrucomicrobiota bacterium]